MRSTRRAALFDLDRTLVRVDTATLYTRYERRIGAATRLDAVKVAWWLLQYGFGVLDAPKIVGKVLAKYAGMEEREMRRRSDEWYGEYVVPHIAEAGRRAVARHQARGDLVAIVTSATPYAADPLAAELCIEHVLCNRLEVEAGRFTGELVPPFCYGRGKIDCAEALAREQGFELGEASFYSDSITDLPLLERVGTPVCVNPDARLRRTALERGYRIEHW
jgi:HAD superfamily hydrolase (TIGR01490 family)